jgi:hypothetical protein
VSALGGIRTPNLLIRSQVLYPLSYERQRVRPSVVSYERAKSKGTGCARGGLPLKGIDECHWCGQKRRVAGRDLDRLNTQHPWHDAA